MEFMLDFNAAYFSVNNNGNITWVVMVYYCGCRVDSEFQMDGELTPLGPGEFCGEEHGQWNDEWRVFWSEGYRP